MGMHPAVWRADVEREIDLIEEIARIYGLDKISRHACPATAGAARLPHYEAENTFARSLIGLGYREILTIHTWPKSATRCSVRKE